MTWCFIIWPQGDHITLFFLHASIVITSVCFSWLHRFMKQEDTFIT